MNRLLYTLWAKSFHPCLLYVLTVWMGFSAAYASGIETGLPLETNVRALRSAIRMGEGQICAYQLEGTILAADSQSGVVFFQDDSGTTALNVNLNGLELKPGQKIQFCGTNYVKYTDTGLSLGTFPVVDVDYRHPTIEKSGEIYLEAGLHPIRVSWFNRTGNYFLQLEYSGPDLARQVIPISALFRSSTGVMLPGLRYRDFEGQWEKIPDFNSLIPQKTGIVSNFDLAIKTREENVGLEFTGFLKVSGDGVYKFYLSSDDGSQLFLDTIPPNIMLVGTAQVPSPQPVGVNQPLPDGDDCIWAETEGNIDFMSEDKGHVELELVSGEKRMQLEILNNFTEIPWYLLNSRVRVRGICPNVKNSAGQKDVAAMIVVNWRDVLVLDVAPAQWSAYRNLALGELTKESQSGRNGIANLHGRVHFDPMTMKMRFNDVTGSAPIELLTGLATETNSDVECLTRWHSDGTNIFLHEAVARELLNGVGGRTNAGHILTTAMEVQRLTRAEAEREYPVKIEGVVTCVSDRLDNFLIQDSTRAVFVAAPDGFSSHFPRIGDYCKIEGVSRPADFSPIVVLQKVTALWRAQMPQPVIPTKDQLLGGSLDAQYVEVRGLVIDTHDTIMRLLTADGILDLEVTPAPSGQWDACLNSIVRIRGCLFANWDPVSHHVTLDEPLRIHAATISIESPPPTDLFEADKMRAKDLMQFDVRFDTFRRVKVHGQILHCTSTLGYLTDDTTGIRFQTVQPSQFSPGDEVEVVGLVELGGASPLLRQAVARKTGHQPLPEARKISLDLLTNNYASTLVSVEATLVGIENHGTEQILNLQVGLKNFVARLNLNKLPPESWVIGSRLKLTGVFCALDGSALAGHDVNSFELLLNSPEDVQVIDLPPWWTLNRLVIVVSCLLVGLTLTFVWISLLRRQVERRTLQLGKEITVRERAEKLRAIEHERSRIARDLHDDLGSTLTEISMMATISSGQKTGSEIGTSRLRQIAEKSRSMISALDGVVWVVNSKNDTLSSLIEYLASHAEEFLVRAQISCRVELPKVYPERIIAAEIRHDVMLAVREALNNAVRHGRPNEVLLRLVVTGDHLEILVEDDGCGFNVDQVKGNGLGNLEQRMKKLNGFCEIKSAHGMGTSITLQLILPQ